MTVNEFLSTLTTTDRSITLVEGDTELITFVSGGYASIESDILERMIESWSIANGKIRVVLDTTPCT